MIEVKPDQCILCQQTARMKGGDFTRVWYECSNCGEFGITESGVMAFLYPQLNRLWLPFRLSAYAREQAIRRKIAGGSPLLLTDPSVGSQVPGATSLADADGAFPKSVPERIDRTLINFARLSTFPGDVVKVGTKEYAVAYADNESAFSFLLAQLDKQGFLGYSKTPGSPGFPEQYHVTLTASGWQRYSELQRGTVGQKQNQAFVAMWFNQDEMGDAYPMGLKAGIEAAGYDALRIDGAEHNNKIDDQIIAEIRKSRFVVADFTGQRGGVYFEAGFAAGLGLPVIWTCRQDHLKELHFDTRQYNHIDWQTPEELSVRLQQRIEATIGRGSRTANQSQ